MSPLQSDVIGAAAVGVLVPVVLLITNRLTASCCRANCMSSGQLSGACAALAAPAGAGGGLVYELSPTICDIHISDKGSQDGGAMAPLT